MSIEWFVVIYIKWLFPRTQFNVSLEYYDMNFHMNIEMYQFPVTHGSLEWASDARVTAVIATSDNTGLAGLLMDL